MRLSARSPLLTPTSANPRMAAWLESAWLARYLDRQLDGEELAWFEAYLLDKPELLDVVEADTTLRDALALAGQRDVAAADGTARRAAGHMPAQQRPGSSWMPLAASVLVGIGVGFAGTQLLRPEADTTPVSNPARLVFDVMRDSGTSGTREEPGDPHSPILLLDVPIPTGSGLGKAQVFIDGRRIEMPPPKVSSEGFVTFAVPAGWRGRGRLVLSLAGQLGGRPPAVLEFPF